MMKSSALILLACIALAKAAPVNDDSLNATQSEDELVAGDDEGTLIIGDMHWSSGRRRNGLDWTFKWPMGIIPYVIDNVFTRPQRDIISSAMQDFHRNTCVRFVPRTSERDYIRITNGKEGCFAQMRRYGEKGEKKVNLADTCFSRKRPTIHELNHIVGFTHEQIRLDRDRFIRVAWENIDKTNYKEFETVYTNNYGLAYDYNSVMHYPAKASSINGKDTMIPWDSNKKIYDFDRLSNLDIEKIRRMYKCT